MEKLFYLTMADSSQCMAKTLTQRSAMEIIKFLLRTTTPCVRVFKHLILELDPYEYSHNPELFAYTKTGRAQYMRNTLQESAKESGFGSLSKAGASAIGVSQTPKAAEMP